MAHPKNPFSLDALIQSASPNNFFFIPLSEAQLKFLAAQDFVTARKIHEVMEPESEDSSNWGLKLQKRGDLSVIESEGIRKIKADFALRAEVLADIGECKRCSEDEAIQILSSSDEWENLPGDLQGKIKDWYFDFDETSDTFAARQITAIVQSRLIPAWGLRDTLSLTKKIFSAFQEFLEGEQSGWVTDKESDLTLFDDEGKDGQKSSVITPKPLEKALTGKR